MGEKPNPLGDLVIYQREFDEAVRGGLLTQEGWQHLYGILASINSAERDTSVMLWRQPRDLAVVSYYSLHFKSIIEQIEEAIKDRMPVAEVEARKVLKDNGFSKPTQTQINNQSRIDGVISQCNSKIQTIRRLHSMIETLEKVISKRGSHVEQISNNDRLRERIDSQAHV